jgi:hypothetical protein
VLRPSARTARTHGSQAEQTGTLTVIQRFGSGLQLNAHFHTLVLDGVFSETQARGAKLLAGLAEERSEVTVGSKKRSGCPRGLVTELLLGPDEDVRLTTK